MRLSKKKSKKLHTADALCEYYSKTLVNLEAYACTNTAYEEYKETINTECYEFSVWMQRQRALGDKSKEYVRRLIEVGRKRGTNLSYAPEEPNYGAAEEYLWFTANYTFKNWSKFRQSYRFSTPMIEALRQTSQNEFMANVFETLPYRSFYLNLENADEHILDSNGQPRKERILGCFVHIDKIEAHGDYVDSWFVYQTFVAEEYAIYSMKNVYYSNEKSRPSDGVMPSENDYEENASPPSNTSELVINMIAYIAASNADITKKPSAPRPSYGSKGQTKKPVTNWDVGFRIGPAIEKALSGIKREEQRVAAGGGSHSSPRPPYSSRPLASLLDRTKR